MVIKNKSKKTIISISKQISSMKRKFPHFEVSFLQKNGLKVTGDIQPTARSNKYFFELKYYLPVAIPKVKILHPQLEKKNNENIPHMYHGDFLCLYQPKYNEFEANKYLSEHLIDWVSLWLYYYETWHITGEWLGGGEHPNT